MKAFVYIATVTIITYLIASFVSWNPNPKYWPLSIRAGAIVFWVFGVNEMIKAIGKDNKENNQKEEGESKRVEPK